MKNYSVSTMIVLAAITASLILASCDGGSKSGGGGDGDGKSSGNSAPRIVNLPDTEIGYIGKGDSFHAAAVDDDAGDTFIWSLSGNTCTFTPAITSAGGLVSWVCPASPQSCSVDVTVTDDGTDPADLSDTETLTIQCLDSTSPEITSTAPGTVMIEIPYLYEITCEDDDGDTLTLGTGLSDSCGGIIVDNGDGTGEYSFTPIAAQAGTQCDVQVTCADSTNTDTQTTTVDIVDKKEWTVMVYLDGDNNLEENAIDDFNEMEQVGSDDYINIVAIFDRIDGYDTSNGNWETARYYYVEKDTNPLTITSTMVAELGEVNMGSALTLENFIEWAVDNYPAKHYMLILWNHGSGWKYERESALKAVAVDNTSGYDELDNGELELALSNALTDTGLAAIDVVGMDACLMQMTEIAYYLRDYADYYVASEEVEPVEGWRYDTWLAELAADPTMSPSNLSEAVVQSYYDSYPAGSGTTLSAVDLSLMDTLAVEVDAFAGELIAAKAAHETNICNAYTSAQYFYDSDYIDLYDFADLISGNVALPGTLRAEAGDVKTAIDNAVVANMYRASAQISDVYGLSIYAPYPSYSSGYNSLSFSIDTRWNNFLINSGCF